MGGKRTWQRKYLLFYLVCIIASLFFLGSCMSDKYSCRQQDQLQLPLLLEARDLMANGNYEAALEKNRGVLKSYPHIGDEALFQIGLIYAHPKYPNKDYKRSAKYFQRVIKDFPESSLRNQAKILAFYLKLVIEKDKRIEKQDSDINTLKNKFDFFIQKNKAKTKEIHDLQEQIKELKRIDLTIEEEKRKSLP